MNHRIHLDAQLFTSAPKGVAFNQDKGCVGAGPSDIVHRAPLKAFGIERALIHLPGHCGDRRRQLPNLL